MDVRGISSDTGKGFGDFCPDVGCDDCGGSDLGLDISGPSDGGHPEFVAPWYKPHGFFEGWRRPFLVISIYKRRLTKDCTFYFFVLFPTFPSIMILTP